MIQADFVKTAGAFTSFSISGHAGYGDYGEDIVCASVTSAVQLTANAATEVFKAPAKVTALENTIQLALPGKPQKEASQLLEALHLHLTVLAETYPGTIKVKVSEV